MTTAEATVIIGTMVTLLTTITETSQHLYARLLGHASRLSLGDSEESETRWAYDSKVSGNSPPSLSSLTKRRDTASWIPMKLRRPVLLLRDRKPGDVHDRIGTAGCDGYARRRQPEVGTLAEGGSARLGHPAARGVSRRIATPASDPRRA